MSWKVEYTRKNKSEPWKEVYREPIASDNFTWSKSDKVTEFYFGFDHHPAKGVVLSEFPGEDTRQYLYFENAESVERWHRTHRNYILTKPVRKADGRENI